VNSVPPIKSRKQLHLKYALDENSQTGDTGLDQIKLTYHALSGHNLNKIDLSTEFIGKPINAPFFISCMTGGPDKAALINQRLAKAAQKYRIPMGLGSLRIVLKHPETLPTFQVRQYAPDIPLMANLGAVSLNYGLTWQDCQKVINLTEADALVLHLNPLQEALQMGGDTDFTKLIPKIEKVVNKLSVPVIVKEVGHGIDRQTALQLFKVGVAIIDTAGVGGTSWAWIEAKIAGDDRRAQLFKAHGLSTYDSINQCLQAKQNFTKRHSELVSGSNSYISILGSGGIRTGLDIAKVLHLGCHLAGIARPFLLHALKSQESVEKFIEQLITELKIIKYCQPVT
jgi:isopentenyl-diphosphate delta-isomerase